MPSKTYFRGVRTVWVVTSHYCCRFGLLGPKNVKIQFIYFNADYSAVLSSSSTAISSTSTVLSFALTSLAIYYLKWSVTPQPPPPPPPFLSVDRFLYHFLTDCEKMNQKSTWEGKKVPVFLSTRHRILAFVRLLGEKKCGR